MSITFKVIAIILVLVGIFIPMAFIINNKKIKKKYSIIPIKIKNEVRRGVYCRYWVINLYIGIHMTIVPILRFLLKKLIIRK